jgi:hypothetical protein
MTDFDNDKLFGKNLTVYGESKMIEPDYKIEEFFISEDMKVYFRVYSMQPTPYVVGPRFGTLEQAKECVRMCRKYENRVWHYVED